MKALEFRGDREDGWDRPPARASFPVSGESTFARRASKVALIASGMVLSLSAAFGAGVMTGSGLADEEAKKRRFLEEQVELGPILRDDLAYRGLSPLMNSGNGSAYLGGHVLKPDDLARLRESLQKTYWNPRAEEMVRGITTGH